MRTKNELFCLSILYSIFLTDSSAIIVSSMVKDIFTSYANQCMRNEEKVSKC